MAQNIYDNDEFLNQREVIGTFQQNPPLGKGDGYRLSASTAGNYSGDWQHQFDSAAFEADFQIHRQIH